MWLRSSRFDTVLQIVPLVTIAPVLVIYASQHVAAASRVIPLAWLFALPFLHVFGSFFLAFSPERNRSPSPPRMLGGIWAVWILASAALQLVAPRALATFALIYGGWHICRQNYGFLRELAARDGGAGDRRLRLLDHAASAAPAVALWLLVMARGPWAFIGAAVAHVRFPPTLLAAALVAVPATAFLRWRRRPSTAALLLLGGNAFALLVPALVLQDLLLIYTLSATFHGIQYLTYVVERERERDPAQDAMRAILPLVSAVILSMVGWFAAVALLSLLLGAAHLETALAVAWYAIVPFHYFVDGRIWRTRRAPRREVVPVI